MSGRTASEDAMPSALRSGLGLPSSRSCEPSPGLRACRSDAQTSSVREGGHEVLGSLRF